MVKSLKQELHQTIKSLEKNASECYGMTENTGDTDKMHLELAK